MLHLSLLLMLRRQMGVQLTAQIPQILCTIFTEKLSITGIVMN